MTFNLKIENASPGAKIKNQFLIFANLFAKLLEIHRNPFSNL
jgi:hypothetical protein